MKPYTSVLLILAAIAGSIILGLSIASSTVPRTESMDTKSAGMEEQATDSAFTFDDLLDAIKWVESKGDPWAIGDNGDAVGAYQIHKIYVDDVNNTRWKWRDQRYSILPKNYSYADRYNADLSRDMVRIYLNHYGGTLEEMARKHNGGPTGHLRESTKAYWAKVKARMESVK